MAMQVDAWHRLSHLMVVSVPSQSAVLQVVGAPVVGVEAPASSAADLPVVLVDCMETVQQQSLRQVVEAAAAVVPASFAALMALAEPQKQSLECTYQPELFQALGQMALEHSQRLVLLVVKHTLLELWRAQLQQEEVAAAVEVPATPVWLCCKCCPLERLSQHSRPQAVEGAVVGVEAPASFAADLPATQVDCMETARQQLLQQVVVGAVVVVEAPASSVLRWDLPLLQ